ncbi:MAG: hypothetical protein EOM78_04155 [Erysipelotrichia bacterium]|nr:hypothetical protein [Erysipelotrichia bacterium]
MRERNVFYNVLKNETSLTEVFCNLMSYKAFRDMFLDLVNQKRDDEKELKHQVIKYEDFSTEKDFGEIQECFEKDENNKIGRGDLILNYHDEDFIFELKVEKYTDLTKNQPQGYLCYLKKQNELSYNNNLYFVLPKGYMHKDQIFSRWQNFCNYPKEMIENNHILYWEDIIKEIRKRELDHLNIIIKEFCEILDFRWFYTKPIHFSKHEIELIFQQHNINNEELKMAFDANIPKIMSKLFEVIEGVADKFDVVKQEQVSSYFGFTLNSKKNSINENIRVWFGTDYEIWQNENVPLMIEIIVDEDEKLEKQINKILSLQKYNYSDGERIAYFIPIKKEIFEKGNIVDILRDEIHEIVNKLQEFKVGK